MLNPNSDVMKIASQIRQECETNKALYQDTYEIVMRLEDVGQDFVVSYMPDMNRHNVRVDVGEIEDGGVSYGVSPYGITANRGLESLKIHGARALSPEGDEPMDIDGISEAGYILSMVRRAHAFRNHLQGLNG